MEASSALDISGFDLVAFTGKGGVGKTTCSAATAVRIAEDGDRTLLLSTDRSPSLSDILETDVYGDVTSINSVEGLDAVELDYEAVAERWKAEFGEEVYSVVSSFMPVDRWVIDYFAEAPGIATQFALSYLLDQHEGSEYDRIVWDTAPAGATIGLIELEEKLYAHLGEAPKFYAQLRAALDRDVTEDPRKLLTQWQELAADILEMVRGDETAFVVVTIPESMAVRETDRIVEELTKRDLGVESIVANNVLTEATCDCAFHRDRLSMQAEHLETLEAAYRDEPGLVSVPQFSTEITGIPSLRTVGRHLFDRSEMLLEDTGGASERE